MLTCLSYPSDQYLATAKFIDDSRAPISCHRDWLVIQRRTQHDVDFHPRSWSDYRNGFGSLTSDYWWGLENMHRLTFSRRYRLQVQLLAKGSWFYQYYDDFKVESELNKYRLLLGNSSGNAGTSMNNYKNMSFTTLDQDNDKFLARNCADKFSSGWWFSGCLSGSSSQQANLNGIYRSGSTCGSPQDSNCILWTGLSASISPVGNIPVSQVIMSARALR